MSAVLAPSAPRPAPAPATTTTPATRPARRESFTGTLTLVRLILRRDRLRLTLWIGVLVALMTVSAQSIASMYDTPERIQTYVDTVGDNPALVVFAGPGYGFDDPNAGVILVNETSLWMALSCALMSVFLVNRHTRAEEESERADLVRSTVVGRHAPVTAAIVEAGLANVAVVVGCAVATLACGFPAAGTLALAGSFGLVGLVFAGSTAVAAQLAGSSRATLGLAAAFAGVAFVVRGIGDIGAPALSWATPFGWGIGMRAFAGEQWWAGAGLVALAIGLLAGAFALSVRRDLGSGILPQRPGPGSLARWSASPLGLAFRLQRGAIIGWAVAMFAAGLVYGTVADDVDEMIADNPELADYMARITGATLTESYLAMALKILALIVGGFAVSSALRGRSEEAAGYAESVLATPVSRSTWTASHLAVTIVGTTTLVLTGGLAMGLSYALTIDDWWQVVRLTTAALASLPAVLLLVGVATLLVGWLPRAALAAWAALAAVALVDLFGPLLKLPDRVLELSPFAESPAVPAEPWNAVPLVVITAIDVGLVLAGHAGFRRRDLATA